MERCVGRVALVTCASVGIGAAVAKALVRHGMKVVGWARNVQQVQNISDELKAEKGSLTAVKCDLNNEEEILAIFSNIQKEFGGVDVWGNVLAATNCSIEAIKQMRNKGADDGHLIILNNPGLVETEFSGMQRGAETYKQLQCLQAEDIADLLIYALSAPSHVQIHDVLMRPTNQVS